MDNLTRKDDPMQEFGLFLHTISSVSDIAELDAMCHDYLYRHPPQRGLELAAGMSWANPFFLPRIPRESLDLLTLEPGNFAEMMMRAKLTAANADRLNVLIAAAPGTAPAFFNSAICAALTLRPATIAAGASSPESLGASAIDQEPDELALVREGMMSGVGYLASHAARATPYSVRLMALYSIRPIVVARNILDTIVAIDEAALAGGDVAVLMPRGFATLDREARLMLVAGRFAAWIAEFHLSWKHAEREGVVRPLFLSYEQDFLGGRHMLARKLSEFLGPKASAIRLSALLDNRDVPAAGQGKDMPRAVRDFVLRMIDGYGQGEDLTLLLGE